MRKEYLGKKRQTQVRSTVLGIGLTIALHGAALALVSCTGLKYLWPPEEEHTFLLDFTVEEPEIPDVLAKDPVSEKPDPKAEVKVVQKSESPVELPQDNATAQSAPPDGFGDVETPAPEPEKPKLDARASFPGMARKDTSKASAPHSASQASASFKAGQADGNSTVGPEAGRSVARLEGRKVEGYLIKPKYDKQESGKVVVRIIVDAYGKVTQAYPGAAGTTVSDKALWAAARNAALQTRFSKASAQNGIIPSSQEGTITYIFNLK